MATSCLLVLFLKGVSDFGPVRSEDGQEGKGEEQIGSKRLSEFCTFGGAGYELLQDDATACHSPAVVDHA